MTLCIAHNARAASRRSSHTCFFQCDLPPYSSYDILRAKLLYAIQEGTAIDTDHGNINISAWQEEDEGDGDGEEEEREVLSRLQTQ